jgi:hypothetical protein
MWIKGLRKKTIDNLRKRLDAFSCHHLKDDIAKEHLHVVGKRLVRQTMKTFAILRKGVAAIHLSVIREEED